MRTGLGLIVFFFFVNGVNAQEQISHSKKKALWFSAAVPGLGELYLGDWKYDKWGTGKAYFAAEAGLWSGYFLLSKYAGWIRHDARTYAADRAGVYLPSAKPARFYVNIGKFRDIYAYNDLQRRATGTELLYEENTGNFWKWDSEKSRKHYDRMRIRSDNTARLAQYLFFGMIANRVLSLVSTGKAYRTQQQSYYFQYIPTTGGMQAELTIRFN
ncbi:MAG: hypothetical protein KDC45_05090 [Bacteroidetes bacterium]|nr:hypothetical protein [Bacteroidota bacterium]